VVIVYFKMLFDIPLDRLRKVLNVSVVIAKIQARCLLSVSQTCYNRAKFQSFCPPMLSLFIFIIHSTADTGQICRPFS